MNYAVIFAGGAGVRMKNAGTPKQFLELYGVPIIIHTLTIFENCEEIDGISIACIESHIPFLKKLIEKYQITKVKWIVPGGTYGQQSRLNALHAIYKERGENDDDIVLIHDGVRPLINEQLLLDNINCVKQNGNAITAVGSVETGVISNDGEIVSSILDRNQLFMAKAPQSFYLKDIYDIYKKAEQNGILDSIDSCCLASQFGVKINFVKGKHSNIKITTPEDFYIFKALFDLAENERVFGLKE